jgi:hypothetical protein
MIILTKKGVYTEGSPVSLKFEGYDSLKTSSFGRKEGFILRGPLFEMKNKN